MVIPSSNRRMVRICQDACPKNDTYRPLNRKQTKQERKPSSPSSRLVDDSCRSKDIACWVHFCTWRLRQKNDDDDCEQISLRPLLTMVRTTKILTKCSSQVDEHESFCQTGKVLSCQRVEQAMYNKEASEEANCFALSRSSLVLL